MLTRSIAVLVILLCSSQLLAQITVETGGMRCEFRAGVVTHLRAADGTVHAGATERRNLCELHLLENRSAHPANGEGEAESVALPAQAEFDNLSGDFARSLSIRVSAETESGDLVIEQSGAAAPGLHGIQWGIAGIPLDYEIIVPARSGIKLERDSRGSYFGFQYPIAWEAQFVIAQGDRCGFWVWAEDSEGVFKNLRIWKRRDCWDLGFETQNLAPFEAKTDIESVRWHLATYQGDWRVPAGRYRDWAAEHFGATKVAQQQPEWIHDIRAMVICGMDRDLLDLLAQRADPRQTILYVPNWRIDGYDRDYPDYTAKPELAPFMKEAHDLGFRVMLHVNYFGCDPENELYEEFEPFQFRDPFSKQKLWWTWPPPHRRKGEEPDIKFAYINPACKAWRELFVSRMRELCQRYDVDALHLDQTLCVWNHARGRIDGMTAIEGSIAEHQQLREALPDVALSGEGLNEVTYRHEAFAQRHVWGINHSEGTWDRELVLQAHPVCSYIMRPYTIINGYLGMSSPSTPQLYAAWRQAYSWWGVIPTLARPNRQMLESPTGFARQLLEEIEFFHDERVAPDWNGDWRQNTMFPYRTASGQPARYVRDNGFALVAGPHDGRTISRTVSGVTEYSGDGTIPGWRAYNDERIFGLDPQAWYPLIDEPRDPDVFHVTDIPEHTEIQRLFAGDDVCGIRLEDARRLVARVSELLPDARCGFTVFGGEGVEVTGELSHSESGAHFVTRTPDLLALHPPWKATVTDPETGAVLAQGTGRVYATMQVDLPADGAAHFRSEVFIDDGAIGQPDMDGVTFGVEATAGEETLRASAHTKRAEPTPLNLDLTALAGKRCTLRLWAGPGPDQSASFDWARWRNARIELDRKRIGTMTLVSPKQWRTAVTNEGLTELRPIGENRYAVRMRVPGMLALTDAKPIAAMPPAELWRLPFVHIYASAQGHLLSEPRHAAAQVSDNTVGGVERPGLFAHPPNRGLTSIYFPVQLPKQPVKVVSWIGLRDGSLSDEGCDFAVEVNGEELVRERVTPGEWHTLSADLSQWAGRTIMLALVTDSAGSHYYDWAAWGEPRIGATQ